MKATDQVNEWINKINLYSPGKTIEGTTKLASNENDYGPSPLVIKGLKEAAGKVYRYPYRDQEAKEALAGYCKARPENIVLGNGSDELIELIVKTFKGTIASHNPTFVEYLIYAQIHNRPYTSSNLNPDFSFNRERFLKETCNADIIFLCTPNNPTGTTIDPKDIEDIAQTGKIVVVDEAYFEFYGITSKNLIPQHPNVIILRTLAKAFGLAGLRMGYAIADPEIAQALNKVRAPFNVNFLAHEAAILAVKDLDYMKKIVSRIIQDRNSLEKRIAAKYRVIPSCTNFLLVDVSPMTSREFFERLLEQRIVVRPQPKFQGFEGNYVRITVGTTEENYRLAEAIDRI